MKMKLGIYLTKKHITSQAFAERMQTSISSVNKWRAGHRIPRREMMLRIEKATKYSVRIPDWFKD